jgi:uncharacterized membrane protein
MKKSNEEIPPVIYKNNPKVVSVLSYLTIVGWLFAYVLNDEKAPLSSFHLRQSLGIYLIFLVIGMLMWIPIVGWVMGILGFLLGIPIWLIGIVSAFREQYDEVPILGKEFQKWFAEL